MKKGGISWDGWVAVCVFAAELLVESVALADKRALALIECMFHSVIISHACMHGCSISHEVTFSFSLCKALQFSPLCPLFYSAGPVICAQMYTAEAQMRRLPG